jgi:hypothetical protein
MGFKMDDYLTQEMLDDLCGDDYEAQEMMDNFINDIEG